MQVCRPRVSEHFLAPFGGITRGFVEVTGLQVHYAMGGTGDQTVIFLHEVPRSWTQFGPSLIHVGRFARFIALDLPGYGNSDEHGKRLTAVEYGEILAGAISQISSDEVWIAGIHSGALFATVMAAYHMVPTKGLLLTGLPMFGSVEPAPQIPPENALGETYDGTHIEKVLPHFQKKWGHSNPTHRFHDAALSALQSVDRMYAGYRAVFECNTSELVASLSCEVHFLSASEDALFAHDRHAARLLPDSIMHLAYGIGRDLPWSAPLWYSSRIGIALSGEG